MKNNITLQDSELLLKNSIATLKLNRNDVRNALTGTKLIEDIIDTVNFLNQSQKYSVLVITGNGVAFSAGGNIRDMSKKNSSFSGNVEEVERKYRNGIQLIPRYLEQLEIPSIAAINGPAIGAGFDLACMCDIRIMAKNAFVSENFINLGIIPGDGGSYFLQKIIGYQRAAELTFTGRKVYAEEALDMGLVLNIYDKEILMDKAYELADLIAKKPPLALRYTKRLLKAAKEINLKELLDYAAVLQGISHNQKDHKDAIKKLLKKK